MGNAIPRQVLFVQGAGGGAHTEDRLLADSLQHELGADYEVIYPRMPDEENAPYDQWNDRLARELAAIEGPSTFVGHSVGASIVAKFLSEGGLEEPIYGTFLIATPFWGGDGWLYEGYQELELPQTPSATLLRNAPVFLYHSRDDEVVPFAHLALYAQLLPQATVREISQGGHQLNNDLSVIASDIEALISADE